MTTHCDKPALHQPGDLTVAAVRQRMASYEAAITELKRRYPTRRAVLLQVLHLAQQEFGWVPRVAIEWAAEVSECSPVHAFSVVEFYTMYRQVPTGRHLVQICQTMCCHLQGSEDLIAHVEKKLGIHCGETTADHLFSLVRVECLALCGSGPGVMIDDQAIGPVPHALGSGKLREGHFEVADFHPTPAVLDAWIDFLRNDERRTTNGEPVAALGDIVLNTKGHPQGVGATAQVLAADYFPACPALKVAAKAENGTVALTWVNDPIVTVKVVVERSDDGGTSWRQVAETGPKDQKAVDKLDAGAAAKYRVIVHEKARIANPSAVVEAKS